MKKLNAPAYETLRAADRDFVFGMVKRGCSRRDVMTWAMAGGASTAAAGALFAGAQNAWAETPKRGGKLTLAASQHGPANTLDPALNTAVIDYFRGRMFYNGLTRLTENMGWEPELAEEVISNDRATQFIFKLRKGVTWSNGKTFDADDVVWSMNRHLGEDTVSNGNALVSMIRSWRKTGKYEVRADLNEPNADLPITLGTYWFKIIQNGAADFTAPAGTGPYKVKEFKPGVRCVGVRNENSWEGGGHLDEIEHFGIGDPVPRLNAFLAGDVDVMEGLEPKSIPQVEAASGKGVWATKSGAYTNILCRMDMRPSGNLDLILAMKHLMDRERMVKGVHKGRGTLGNDHPISPHYFDHCAEIPQREMDPDLAKFHFQKSGVGSTPVPIVTAVTKTGTVEQALFLQREAKKIGLNIDVQKAASDGYWSTVWMTAPICTADWNMRPTANLMMTLAFKSDAAWNETYHQDREFDRLLVEARAVVDLEKRKEIYRTLQEKIRNENGSIIPAHYDYVDAAADYVKGRTSHPTSAWGGAECPPYLWRADV